MYIQVKQNIGKTVGMEIKIPQILEEDIEQRLALRGGSLLPLRPQRKSKKRVKIQQELGSFLLGSKTRGCTEG